MRSALGCTALGVLLLLVAGTFNAEPFYVTGSALVLLGLGAIAWVRIRAIGAAVHRTRRAGSVMEEEPLTVRIEALAGRLPLPPGYIDEPLLSRPVPLSPARRRSALRIEATCGRRGRRMLEPPSIVLRDPLGLVEKRIAAPAPDE